MPNAAVNQPFFSLLLHFTSVELYFISSHVKRPSIRHCMDRIAYLCCLANCLFFGGHLDRTAGALSCYFCVYRVQAGHMLSFCGAIPCVLLAEFCCMGVAIDNVFLIQRCCVFFSCALFP